MHRNHYSELIKIALMALKSIIGVLIKGDLVLVNQ